MNPTEAVVYLEAILEDTLEPDDERDVKRREAVKLAIDVLKSYPPPRKGERYQVSGPAAAYNVVKHLARKRKEHLVGLYLDAQNGLIRRTTLSVGGLNTTRTHPREILLPAIKARAMGFILAHNHPSGSKTPSQEDVDFTRSVKRAADLVGIPLYDHLIVADGWFVSLKEKGLL